MSEALLYTVRVWRQAGAFRAALQPVGGEPAVLATDPHELARFFDEASRRSAQHACGCAAGAGATLPAETLSPRQFDIASRYARGDTHRQVAQALGLSPATVRNHLSHIYDKLQVRHRAGLIAALGAALALRGPHV